MSCVSCVSCVGVPNRDEYGTRQVPYKRNAKQERVPDRDGQTSTRGVPDRDGQTSTRRVPDRND